MGNRPLVAGNWKMNGRLAELAELAQVAGAAAEPALAHCDVLLCPPATLLHAAKDRAGAKLALGGQDCHAASSGAHTGNVSAEMLADLGASHVIVGHSERRTDHRESDADVRGKTEAAVAAGLVAVLCIGETEAERVAGDTLDVLGRQLDGSIPPDVDPARLVIAYEPVWAIGTGKTPTVEDVRAAHAFIRGKLVERFGDAAGRGVRILYGGSVKPSNAAELLSVENVDGALVGGASLKAADFIAICRASPATA